MYSLSKKRPDFYVSTTLPASRKMYPHIKRNSATKGCCPENAIRRIDHGYLEPPLRIVDGAVLAQQERLNRVDVYIRVLYPPASHRPSGSWEAPTIKQVGMNGKGHGTSLGAAPSSFLATRALIRLNLVWFFRAGTLISTSWSENWNVLEDINFQGPAPCSQMCCRAGPWTLFLPVCMHIYTRNV
jgi:hypothetical protein